ncbi:nuclear transport factor 2 family protein [Humitalea sp. 24SJ18S-53]|uniref:nuclear transport factor 2 family protein n=1 Tax=Humitalea sp. 24SJ18S-53 TaxID=3422307 RepID=UPI003D67850B
MSDEAAIAAVRRWFAHPAAALLHPQVHWRICPGMGVEPTVYVGPDDVMGVLWPALHARFSYWSQKADEMIAADGGRVVVRGRIIAQTRDGRRLSACFIDIVTVSDGLIVAVDSVADTATLMPDATHAR